MVAVFLDSTDSVKSKALVALAYAMSATELRLLGWTTPGRARRRCLSAPSFQASHQSPDCTLQASLAQLDEG